MILPDDLISFWLSYFSLFFDKIAQKILLPILPKIALLP